MLSHQHADFSWNLAAEEVRWAVFYCMGKTAPMDTAALTRLWFKKVSDQLMTGQEMSMKEEIRNYQFWKAVRTEFLVTMLLVLLGCGSMVIWGQGQPLDEIKIALCFGLAVSTFAQCVGHISGAHMNPAVTVAMLVTRNISVLRAIMYTIAQCIGGIAGAGILYGLTPESNRGNLGLTSIHPELQLGQAFGVEFMITFVLVFTVFANVDPKRADMGSRSLSIGLSVTLGHLFGFNYTKSGMNPARALGPAVITNIWQHHWIYWVGPILGGILGGFTYDYTHDSSNTIQNIKRSFRRKPPHMKRSRSLHGSNDTEMTMTSDDCRV